MGFLLKLKNWQLFILIFSSGLLVALIYSQNLEGLFFDFLLNISFVVYLLTLCLIPIQYWLVATKFNTLIPNDLKLDLKLFKICFIYLFFGIVLFVVFLLSWSQELQKETIKNFFFLFIVLFLISIYYVPYVISKIIRTIELNREVDLSEHLSLLHSLINFPFGLWFYQPRINRIAKQFHNKQVEELKKQ